jgi:hypothetical protein
VERRLRVELCPRLPFYQTDASGPGVRRAVGVIETDPEWGRG